MCLVLRNQAAPIVFETVLKNYTSVRKVTADASAAKICLHVTTRKRQRPNTTKQY
jgi:hypothetical protein